MSDLAVFDPGLSLRPLPASLDGHQGGNRAEQTERKLIAADSDLEAIGLWLAEYADSPHTLRSYRKEATRLVLWATEERGKPVSSLTREDFVAFETFLRNPSSAWCDPARSRVGSERRLMTGPMSPASVRQSMGILSGLLSYLVEAGYLAANPLALRRSRHRQHRARPQVERYLDVRQWAYVLESIERLPQSTPRERQNYERARWTLRFIYQSALRVSEAAAARVCDLTQRRGRWWLTVTGKGGVTGEVPISDELVAEFARYRRFHHLPPVPSSLDRSPMILSIAGKPDHLLTPTSVYLIVKEQFCHAATLLRPSDPAGAALLRRASTHWLRHTAATHQADAGTDLRHIQRNLRHSSIETTAIYLHAEDDERHRQTTRIAGGPERKEQVG